MLEWVVAHSRFPVPPFLCRAAIAFAAVLIAFTAAAGDQASSAANDTVVVLDPGHGGDESGAAANGIVERDSNFDMAYRVRRLLTAAGVDVELTRSTYDHRADGFDATGLDASTATFLDLQARVERTNKLGADVMVSLHSNSYVDSGPRGVDVVYNSDRPFSDQNEVLAELLRAHVVAELEALHQDVPSHLWDDRDLADAYGRHTPMFVLGPERELSADEVAQRGLRPEALGLTGGATSYRTDATNAPGALIELLYLSNEQDAALLRDDVAREAMARGVADAILVFLRARAAAAIGQTVSVR